MPRFLLTGTGAVLGLLLCQARVAAQEAAPSNPPGQPPSFVNDVLPVLTRLGCNQGACHGKGAGQNGFRLSLRGYAPE